MYRYITDNRFWYSLIVVTSGYANKCSLILDQIIKGESAINKDLGQKCYIKNSKDSVTKSIGILNQCINKNKFREMYFPDFGGRDKLLKSYSIVSEFLSDFADTILFRNYTNRKGRKITTINTLLSTEDVNNIKYFHRLYTLIFEQEYDKAILNLGLYHNVIGFRRNISIASIMQTLQNERSEVINMDIAKFFNNVDMKKFFDNDVVNILFDSISGKKYEYLEYVFNKPLDVSAVKNSFKEPEDLVSCSKSFKFNEYSIYLNKLSIRSVFAFPRRIKPYKDIKMMGRLYKFFTSGSNNVLGSYKVNDSGSFITLREPSMPDKREYFLHFFYRTLSFLMHNNKLPTGASYSPVLSNIFLLDFDIKLKSLLKDLSTDVKYNFIRYADDITIYTSNTSAENKIDFSIAKKVDELVNQYGLHLNYSKTKIFRRHEDASILGLVVPAPGKTSESTVHIGSTKRKEMIDLISSSLDFNYDPKTKGFLSYCINNNGTKDFVIHHGMNVKLNDDRLRNVFDKYFDKSVVKDFRELFYSISKNSKASKSEYFNSIIRIYHEKAFADLFMKSILIRKYESIGGAFTPNSNILERISIPELRLTLIYYILYKDFLFNYSYIGNNEFGDRRLFVKVNFKHTSSVSFPLDVFSDFINDKSYYSDLKTIFYGDKIALEFINLFETIENSIGVN